jgi:putative spermidine/putrescine transport system ATP-binding protein
MDGLVIQGLTKQLGGNVVVRDLSLVVLPGQLCCLLGPSGCGKTTTLRMIGGFLVPETGSITINGADVTTSSPEKRPTAMVFQSYALWPHMTVTKNIAFGLRLRKMPKPEVAQRVDAALTMVNLSRLRDRRPAELSGGEQQRVALARALVLEPEVLLLDEPLSNLDAKLRVVVREEIREIQQRLGITTVFVTHDQDEALSIADQVAVMSGGRIEQLDDADSIYRRPRTSFVAGFVGSVNRYHGWVDSDGVHLPNLSRAVPCDHAVASDGPANHADLAGEWEIVVRPEDVQLGNGCPGPDGAPGRLVREVRHGHFKEAVVRLDDREGQSSRGDDGGVAVRVFLPPDFHVPDRPAVGFRRLLLYRDGSLVHELGNGT